jgi:antitoxin MazE
MSTTVSKWGNSLGLRIPIDVAKKANIKEGDHVNFTVKSNCDLVLKKEKSRRSISEIIGNYNGKYEFEEVDWGKPEGDEIW